ncbi:MAG: OmpH family outer membrane protein [Nitrospiraceae bacterium]
MWHSLLWVAAGLGVALGLGSAWAVEAAETVKVGVVDQQSLVERTVAGKRALESLKEFSVSRQRILAADNQEMQDLEKGLRDAPPDLSEAAKKEKQEKFRVKYEGYQRRIQDFQREVQAKQKEMDREYQKKITELVSDVAQKQGLTAVIDRGTDVTLKIVIYVQPALDVTEAVIKEFDRRYK